MAWLPSETMDRENVAVKDASNWLQMAGSCEGAKPPDRID